MKLYKLIPTFISVGGILLTSCNSKGEFEKIYDFYKGLDDKPVVLNDNTTLEIIDLNYGPQGFHISSDITVERKDYEVKVQPGDTYLYTNVVDFRLTMSFASCSKPDREGDEKWLADDVATISLTAKYGDGNKTAKEVEEGEYLYYNFFTTDDNCKIIFTHFEEAPITRTLIKLEAPRVLKLYKNWLEENKLSTNAVNGLNSL